MKRKILTSALVLILVVVMATASLLTACVENKDTTLIGIAKLDKTTFFKGESVTLHVFVQPEGEYTISADPANAVTIQGDKVTFTGDITEDTTVTLTATLNRNPKVKNSIAVTYKAPAQVAPVTNISISADKTTAVKGDTVNLTVTVDPVADYTIKAEPANLVVLQDNTATFVGDITLDKFVTFTAILNENTSVKATVGVTYKAPVKEGQVGELTSEMIEAIGNPSITIIGTVTDHYENFDNVLYSRENVMDMTVKMEEGKWFGEWYYQGYEANKITDNFRRGEGIIIDLNGNESNPLLQVYVDKNNQVASKMVMDSFSRLSSWQIRHMWNHLGMLDVAGFEYDAESELYIHYLDDRDEDDQYLMTYLAFALTPMLEDTLVQIAFKVEGGKIVGMTGQTEILYDGDATMEADQASEMSYTTFDITFYDVGTTTVEDPAVYDAPEYVELLESALEQMQSADNYTFNAVEHSTREPNYDAGDYELQSTNTVYEKRSPSVKNHTSGNGTVGLVGYVTKDAILFAETTKYLASLDGKDYKTEYSGYKQNDDNTFDFFKYNSENNAMKGDRKYPGTLADVLPKFDFSANIFTFDGSRTVKGVKQYTFVLVDSAITKDVSKEISMHKNASNGAASVSSKLSIVVDENGNLVSTSFPYSHTGGEYMGYITTTYSKFNTTEIAEDTFDDYIPRVVAMVWEDAICDELTRPQNAQTVIDLVFPGKTLPTPKAFFEVFGDAVNYFFDQDYAGSDPDGNAIYKYKFTLNAKWAKDLDENGRITNYDEIWNKIDEVFALEGYKVDRANTNEQWHTLINEETQMQIVFQSWTNAYIYMQIYNLGEWTLKN